jgi:hypothetical protein
MRVFVRQKTNRFNTDSLLGAKNIDFDHILPQYTFGGISDYFQLFEKNDFWEKIVIFFLNL